MAVWSNRPTVRDGRVSEPSADLMVPWRSRHLIVIFCAEGAKDVSIGEVKTSRR